MVMEERRLRTEDKPTSLTCEQFMATAYTSSSYRIPTIGWMDDLENMQLADLQHWYDRWYAPNNATVVVVGDVDCRCPASGAIVRAAVGEVAVAAVVDVAQAHL